MGEAEGILEEKERVLIETMVEFGETRAGEIMTPRTEIVASADKIDSQRSARFDHRRKIFAPAGLSRDD